MRSVTGTRVEPLRREGSIATNWLETLFSARSSQHQIGASREDAPDGRRWMTKSEGGIAMNRLRGTAVIVGLCAALTASSAGAESSLFVGRWHWNRALSTLPPGEPAPNDLTSEISRAGSDRLTWSVTIVTPDGPPDVVTFDVPADGKSYPVGSDTAASARVTGDTLQATFREPGGQSDAQTCIVAADQKQMTCRGVLTDGDGQTVTYVDVYDRM